METAIRQQSAAPLAAALDRERLTRLQLLVILLCGCVAALDGFDTQAIGYTGRLIAAKVGFDESRLGIVIAAGLSAAMIGAFLAGGLADRYGRKRILVIASAAMGVFSGLTMFVEGFWQLILLRLLAGLALGGATPCFIVLALEFTPGRHRDAVSGYLYAAFPAGGAIGAVVSALLLRDFGWEAVFLMGGILPLLLAAVLAVALPESPIFMIVMRHSRERLLVLLRRLLPSKSSAEIQEIIAQEAGIDRRPTQSPTRVLFSDGRTLPTIALWLLFPAAFASASLLAIWTAPLLQRTGVSPALTGLIVAAVNGGAVLGSLATGTVFHRLGRNRVLIAAYLLTAATWLGLATARAPLGALIGLAAGGGVMVGLGSTGLIATAARLYPAVVRGSGVGRAMGLGRLGQAIGPLCVGVMLSAGLPSAGIFRMLAVPALISILALFLLMFAEQRRAARAS